MPQPGVALERLGFLTPRTAAPLGAERLLFARDIIGTSAEIAAALYAHPAFREVTEVAFALPLSARSTRTTCRS